jgi:hypothetical protein
MAFSPASPERSSLVQRLQGDAEPAFRPLKGPMTSMIMTNSRDRRAPNPTLAAKEGTLG